MLDLPMQWMRAACWIRRGPIRTDKNSPVSRAMLSMRPERSGALLTEELQLDPQCCNQAIHRRPRSNFAISGYQHLGGTCVVYRKCISRHYVNHSQKLL